MNSSESSQPLRDPRQITFVMLNRFWSLSKNPFTPSPPPPPSILPILNGQYQTACCAKHKFWEGTSVKSYKIQLPVFLFLVLHQFLYQQISFSQLSKVSFNIIWKKKFHPKFSFFNGFTPSLNGKNVLNVTKLFCWFSLSCLLKYFFSKNLLTKSCKAFF